MGKIIVRILILIVCAVEISFYSMITLDLRFSYVNILYFGEEGDGDEGIPIWEQFYEIGFLVNSIL